MSALIHAATMVTAGVFLLVRAHVLFDVSNHAGTVVAWIGAITALVRGDGRAVQNDIKRVLAYSTISQLGYMFLAVGVGAYSAAIFHMVTHAFFKALLFLGAGSVIHGMHDEQDMRRMGGLRKFMPITAGTFIVGWLAIAGIIPFAGFWSKDEILAKAWSSHNYGLWAVGAVAALFTAFYMTRQVWLVFFGPERWRDDAALAGSPRATPRQPNSTRNRSRPTPVPTPATPADRARARAARVAVDDVHPARRARRPLRRRRPARPAVHERQAQRARPLARAAARRTPTVGSFGAGVALSTVALVDRRGRHPARRPRLPQRPRAPTAPTRPSKRLGGFAGVLENACYLDIGLARLVSGPVTAFARFLSDGVDRAGIDGAVNGIATRCARRQRRLAPAADRPGAQLRAGHRARHGAPPALRRDPGDLLMLPLHGRPHHDRVEVVGARLSAADLPRVPPGRRRAGHDAHARPPAGARAHRRLRHEHGDVRHGALPAHAVRHQPAQVGLPALRGPLVDRSARRPVDARRRRHQPVHGGAQRAAVPDRAPRVGQGRRSRSRSSCGCCCSSRR